jgi:hypothetical protein
MLLRNNRILSQGDNRCQCPCSTAQLAKRVRSVENNEERTVLAETISGQLNPAPPRGSKAIHLFTALGRNRLYPTTAERGLESYLKSMEKLSLMFGCPVEQFVDVVERAQGVYLSRGGVLTETRKKQFLTDGLANGEPTTTALSLTLTAAVGLTTAQLFQQARDFDRTLPGIERIYIKSYDYAAAVFGDESAEMSAAYYPRTQVSSLQTLIHEVFGSSSEESSDDQSTSDESRQSTTDCWIESEEEKETESY